MTEVEQKIADAIATITRLCDVTNNTVAENESFRVYLGGLKELLVLRIGKRILAEREHG